MARVIKFRALKDDMSNCKWVYGYLVVTPDGTPRITNDVGGLYHSCLKGTEGQFTGLQDSKGVDIYEGDIVLANGMESVLDYDFSEARKYVSPTIQDNRHFEERRSNYEVYWQNNFSQFSFMSLSQPKHSIESDVSKRQLEIIGNIHETPNLIKHGN